VSGVSLYISDFSRPITERLSKDFFSDPSTASMTCAADGPVALLPGIDESKAGEEVFDEKRSIFFKSIKVRRIVDKEAGNVVYVAYSSKFNAQSDDNKSRFKSSLCAIHYDR
jgi:CreA protein